LSRIAQLFFNIVRKLILDFKVIANIL